MKREIEDGYRRTNREMSKEPRSGKGYCFGCDGSLLSEGQKCPVCKVRMTPYRAKKPVVKE